MKDVENNKPTEGAHDDKPQKKRRCLLATGVFVVLVVGVAIGIILSVKSSSSKQESISPVEDGADVDPEHGPDEGSDDVPDMPGGDFVPPSPDAPPTLPAIGGFLFKGYNLLKGNPNPTDSGNDPGFQEQIFAATYASGHLTGDARFSIPDGISVIVSDSCSVDFSSTTMESVREYSEKLSRNAQVSGSGSGWGVTARFSASFDYRSASEELASASSTMVHSQAECAVYESEIETFSPPPFSANFLNGLRILPNEYDASAYSTFLDSFGTHYVTETTMGAIFGEQSFISESSLRTLESMGYSLEASASASGFGASVEASGGQAEESEELNEFRKLSVNRKQFTRGSRLPVDGDAAAWANSAFESPQAVTITLARLDTIYGLDQAVPSPAVLDNLRRAIDDFCTLAALSGEIATCDPTEYNFSRFTVPTHQNGVVLTGDQANSAYGELLAPVSCNEGAYVNGFRIVERENVGVVDAVLDCSDGATMTAAGGTTTTGSGLSCPQGLDAIRPYGQIHCCGSLEGVYNIIGMEASCEDSFQRPFFGYRGPGNQGEDVEVHCDVGERVVGIQVASATSSDRGLTRLRLVCRKMGDN